MTPNFRKHLAWGSASLVFGVFLIWFANRQGFLGTQRDRFAIGVLAVAWIVVVALLGRYFRDNPVDIDPEDR